MAAFPICPRCRIKKVPKAEALANDQSKGINRTMQPESSYRGWMAALTVAITLTLALMTVDKHLSLTTESFWELAERFSPGTVTETQGIILHQDDNLLGRTSVTPNYQTQISRRRLESSNESAGLLRRPPEPAASAVLHEPLTAEDFVSLPLTLSSSSTELLMQSMDAALDSPLKMVSSTTAPESAPQTAEDHLQPSESKRSPTELVGKIPEPIQLLDELKQLQSIASADYSVSLIPDESFENGRSVPHYVTTENSRSQASALAQWARLVQDRVTSLVEQQGLEVDASREIMTHLQQLSEQGQSLGEQLTEDHLAQMLMRTGYSLQRRVEVWQAVQACLDDTSIRLSGAHSAHIARSQVARSITDVEKFLESASDRTGWRSFLLLDELSHWAHSQMDDWQQGNRLARNYLSRVRWERLDDPQRKIVGHQSISDLTGSLAAWSRNPVDYRQLLTSLEKVEQDSNSKQVQSVADTISILRHPDSAHQQRLANTLNTHFRNANLRLTVSKQMIERFLPEGQYEVRPVRERILGADTKGDSAVRTQLSVQLQPDPSAWNVLLQVKGDLVSDTRSSKGPAVFHNSSTAQVASQRNVRMSPMGYQVSSTGATQVSSQEQLQKMSTDFDGLPVIGDFARLIVREQFNQKKGLAKRITQRKISQEADQAFDDKLEEALQKAQQELQQRILGPLERLTLDPLVVSMSTTEDRLSIRYRLASENQLTSHTPRPRAPSDCLTSFQIHQSVINNTIEKTQLSGRSWTLTELYQRLGEMFQTQMTPPEDIPDDISVRFADHCPIWVDLQDGRFRLNLKFAEFRREEGLLIKNFVVTSAYVPYADGLVSGLVRDPDSSIEIQAKHLPMRDRLALRVIFAKVFVSKPRLPLVSPEWAADPRAEGLAISQMELRDGWLAVAISGADHPLVTEIARRNQRLQSASYQDHY